MTPHCFCSVFYRCQTVPYVNKYGSQTGSENDVLSVSVERWRIQWKTSLLVVDKGLTHSHLSRQRRAHVSRHSTTYCLVLITYRKWTHNCKVKDNRSRNVEVQPFVSASVAVIRHRTMNTTVSTQYIVWCVQPVHLPVTVTQFIADDTAHKQANSAHHVVVPRAVAFHPCSPSSIGDCALLYLFNSRTARKQLAASLRHRTDKAIVNVDWLCVR